VSIVAGPFKEAWAARGAARAGLGKVEIILEVLRRSAQQGPCPVAQGVGMCH